MFERLFALHSFVLTYSVVIVHGAGDIRLLFKLLLKFRNFLKHTESRSSLACNQSIKEDIPTALEVFLCFETKRNDINSPRNQVGFRATLNFRKFKVALNPTFRIFLKLCQKLRLVMLIS